MLRLPAAQYDISAERRIAVTRLLSRFVDFDVARNVEANIHGFAINDDHYNDLSLRCALNCRANADNASEWMMCESDEALAKGTILERIRQTKVDRDARFQRMLQEKYESISKDKGSYTSSLKCRRCNSNDVSWEQKQTRSADEGMSVYCACGVCGNRWTLR